ncbi:type VII secretion integral membrane protein EccD [Rhodococcus spelaei]|uniref:Type VII secretion integral membrane protein EccD n=1 Tax=Rhodococcus spelaei TaxID=2546320 RepID=A0A541B984_9NOCA|nr:type VII secretion integral membrane protein EccD [Rhodococcus spelaei]TQF68864.1 type VII secretion integral membrane protein EccD [Rhodococcus spelaei]
MTDNLGAIAGTTAGRRSARTDLCRLTVLTDQTQVDLALPFGVPLALILPGIVDMIEMHGASDDHTSTRSTTEATEWVLSRIGQAPLSSTLSLDEHGILDGDLLVLHSATTRAPAPLFDDLMHNVAAIDAQNFRRWTPATARATGIATASTAILAGSMALLRSRAESESLVGAFAALVVAALLLTAGVVVSRVYGDRPSATALCGFALPVAATAGALLVPGHLGAANLLLGSVTCAAAAILAMRTSGVGLALCTATAAGSLLAGAAAAVGAATELPTDSIGAGVVAAALAGLAVAPRLAMLLAKLPLPPVPAPGSPLDAEELDEAAPGPLPSFVGLEAKAAQARQYLTGLVVATAVTATGGALLAAGTFTDGGIYWPGTVLAVVCATVLMLRGRAYASAAQAVPLISSGAAILVALLVGAAVTSPGQAPAVFAVAVLGVCAAMALGVLAPNHTFSPVLRRCVELLDYAAIAAVIPLVCWVSGLFATMRGL